MPCHQKPDTGRLTSSPLSGQVLSSLQAALASPLGSALAKSLHSHGSAPLFLSLLQRDAQALRCQGLRLVASLLPTSLPSDPGTIDQEPLHTLDPKPLRS